MLTLLPKTPDGKKSVYMFLGSFVLGFIGNRISNMQGNTIEYPNPINSPLLGSVIYLTFFIVAIAFLFGLKALVKSKERSVLVFLITVIGGFFSITALLFLVIGTFGGPQT